MNHGPFLAFMKDADGRYVYENHELTEHIGRIRPGTSTCIGRTDRDLFPPAEEKSYVDNDRLVLERQGPMQFDESSVDADGTVRHWSTIKFPRRDELGRPCIAGISIDVTEARRAKQDARSTGDRCALALEAGRMGTMTMNLADGSLETSPLFALLHGRPETKTRLTLEESLAEVHPDDRQSIMDAVQAAIQDAAPDRITYRVVRTDGTVAWIELLGRVCADDEGRPNIVRGVGFDVTERQTYLEELTGRKAVLRRLIEVQENERQTLCHDLHDGMMQHAIGAKMLLESIVNVAGSAEQGERIDAALDFLNRGIEEGRRLIRGVRSAVLDDLGLVAAIQDLSDQIATHGIAVDMALDDGLDDLPPTLQTTVYRVVQESLTNVRKHAETDRTAVEICRTPADVVVRVSDSGRGFDVDDGRRRGFGLVGMTERVRLIGGSCTIESRLGSGSRVEARLPVSQIEAAGVSSPSDFQLTRS
jgi:PAS domain S-box-containing protein